jgi:hypothetical protein
MVRRDLIAHALIAYVIVGCARPAPDARTLSLRHSSPLVCEQTAPQARSLRRPLVLSFEALRLTCPTADRWAVESDGAWFNVARKGAPSAQLRSCAGRTGRGLGISLPPSDPVGDSMDKVVLDVLGRYESPRQMLEFDRTYAIELSFTLEPDSELPIEGGRMLLFQLWQGAPFGPPLRIELEPDGTMAVYLLDDETGSSPCASNPRCTLPATSSISGARSLLSGVPVRPPREWNHVSLVVTPRHRGYPEPGRVRISINGHEASHHTHLGFEPSAHGGYPGTTRHPNALLEVGFGVYRTRQPRTHSLCFDDFSMRELSATPSASK